MPLPRILEGRLRLPVIAAPMFLVSGPELVIECCRAGAGIAPGGPAVHPLLRVQRENRVLCCKIGTQKGQKVTLRK